VRSDQIATMKQDASSAKAHPMALKKDLARTLVADFHSAEAATKAAEDWAKQFQKGGVPEDVEEVTVSFADFFIPPDTTGDVEGIKYALEHGAAIKLDRLLKSIGLAESVSDGARKLKQRAVKVNGEVKTEPAIFLGPRERELTLRVGRRIKKVLFTY